MAHLHVDLTILGATPGSTQPVAVERLDGGLLRVLRSPGFVEGIVEGIAAGDTIRLLEGGVGAFEVVARGGNLCLKVFCLGPVAAVQDRVATDLAPLGGVCDGSIERAAVFTIPGPPPFAEVERIMDGVTSAHEGVEWYFANAYADDGVTPLSWWRDARDPGSTGDRR